jgi:hypothetical protein
MSPLDIPHAPKSFEGREPPLRVLHVVTDLKHRPESPGFDPEAHDRLSVSFLMPVI